MSKKPLSKKIQEGILSLVAGALIGASSASLSSKAAEECIERTDTIGITIIHQKRIPGTLGCIVELKAKGATEWAHTFSPSGKKLVKFEGLDKAGLLSIKKADGSRVKIDSETFEIVSSS